jgi:hypothetical protein
MVTLLGEMVKQGDLKHTNGMAVLELLFSMANIVGEFSSEQT